MSPTAKTVLAASSLLGALAIAAQAAAGPMVQPAASEKCYGVSKAGKNDCAAGSHSCAGQSNKSFDKSAFVYLPKGACEKLAGGALTAAK